jgi:hypothetical protein
MGLKYADRTDALTVLIDDFKNREFFCADLRIPSQ